MRKNDVWSDGAPTPRPAPGGTSGYNAPTPASGRKYTDGVTQRVSRIVQFEGLRGRSTRAAVVLRYIAYALLTLGCAAVTQISTEGIRNATGGGWFLLMSCTLITATGAFATILYPNTRHEIIHRVRHYVFGIVAIPGAILALFLKAAQNWMGSGDTLAATLGAAGPIVFLATIVLPAFVFVKEMFGIRTLNRSRLDDEEAVLLWTRQDGIQR
jgi:hypothetical protein